MNNGSTRAGYPRREFLRRFSLGVGAALTLPAFGPPWLTEDEAKYYRYWEGLPALPKDQQLRIALVGLGTYATEELAPALQQTKLCRLSGIVTGTPEKEQIWAERYDIPEANIYNYETFDRIADNPDIDVIYIVLPPGMHAEYSIRAAQAGKHVICEKPMATSVEDCQAIIDACRQADRKLSMGYRLHFEPYNEEVMRLGQQQVFGPVERIESELSFPFGGSPTDWRLDRELAGGGPLLDIGVYVVQGAIYTLGELPVAVTGRVETNNTELFSEVEESVFWQMEFPSGVVLEGTSSYAQYGNALHAEARNGHFSLGPAYTYGPLEGETSRGPMDYPHVTQQTLQMDAFADHILNGKENRVPGEMGLRDVKIMMAVYESAARGGERVVLDL